MTDSTETNTTETQETILYTYANPGVMDRELQALLRMFYSGAYDNKIGIMHALNIDTKTEEIVLVGIEKVEGAADNVFPIAKILKAEDIAAYRSPDGEGGYHGVTNVAAD